LITEPVHDRRIEEITVDILQVIASTTGVEADGLEFTDDLYNAGLKSLAAIRLIAALEDRFGIAFPQTALHRGAFSTIERIRATVLATLLAVNRGN
jgi:acyl carrier protein